MQFGLIVIGGIMRFGLHIDIAKKCGKLFSCIFLLLFLFGCESGAEKFFDSFYQQSSGEWKSKEIKLIYPEESQNILPTELYLKLGSCFSSQCFVDVSFDDEEYIKMPYNRAQGTGKGGMELTSMILSFNQYIGEKETLSNEQLFFVDNIQGFHFGTFSASELKTELFFESGEVLNVEFIRN